ncbi:hypothetical protein IQ07DRAFT_655493 [Pyrenochaeta sp. DS3sAY3a]|nr:hypothetical protein IQ07DRAFT_655493 [Pyrenochaeta sp. DS3sAY3a]
MPRVRVPNPALIARADCPVLPFLLPRVIAESRIHRDVHHATEKETDTALAGHGTLAPTLSRTKPHNNHSRHVSGSASHRKPPTTPVGLLYADISSFARQHIRAFSTATSPKETNNRTKPSQSKSHETRPTRSTPAPPKALEQEERRLSRYLARYTSRLSSDDIYKSGQYRSICRRIDNLQHWNRTHLDLSERNAHAVSRSGLIQAFAALDRRTFPSLAQHTREITLEHDPQCAGLVARLFSHSADWTQTGNRWMELDHDSRRKWYQRLLLYLLDCEPSRALDFIQVLAHDELLRGSRAGIIADALEHLSNIHRGGKYDTTRGWGDDPEANSRSFIPAFVHIFKPTLCEQKDVCSQELLYNLVGLAQGEDLKEVFRCLSQSRTGLSFDTLLHYANAFGEAGHHFDAIRCLKQLKMRFRASWESVVDRQRLRWTCALILRKSMSKSQAYHETPSIVASFVQLGIKMDITLYNVVMHNAMEAGDHSIAFKVYNTLESNGLEPDAHTFSILLQGCTVQDDSAIFHKFAQHCAEKAKELKHPYLATDYLYYHYMLHNNIPDPGQTAATLWQSFLKFFSAEDLQPLIIEQPDLMASVVQQSSEPEPKVESSSMAMYIMLRAELRSAQAVSTHRVSRLYKQFRDLAQTPALSELAQQPVVWNAFLLAFCQKSQFADASQVIKDMSNGFAQPNVYSWNILMQAFFKTNQVQAAERVFDIMRDRGVVPDQYTYGVLLRGYAKAQMVDRVGEIMQHKSLDQELEPDLLALFARVVDRKKLTTTLEKSRIYRENKAQTKAKQLAGDQRRRWEPKQFERSKQKQAKTPKPETHDTELPTVPQEPSNEIEEP